MNKLVEKLRDNGHRLTEVRKAILAVFKDSKLPLTAAELLAQVALQPNKTTIYRELEFLLREGVIRTIEFGDRKKRFELANVPHHHHLVCQNCDRVQDVELEKELSRQEQKISKDFNFQVKSHQLEFFGLCKKCKAKN